MFAMFLLELVLVLAIIGAIIMVITAAVKSVTGKSVLPKRVQQREDETSSLNRKISELTQKRTQLNELRKEFGVTAELAELDRQLVELRGKLAAVEGRQGTDPATR